jgi:hypothetical protein
VVRRMCRLVRQLEILDPIIRPVAVPVMNDLALPQLPSEMLLHHDPML